MTIEDLEELYQAQKAAAKPVHVATPQHIPMDEEDWEMLYGHGHRDGCLVQQLDDNDKLVYRWLRTDGHIEDL